MSTRTPMTPAARFEAAIVEYATHLRQKMAEADQGRFTLEITMTQNSPQAGVTVEFTFDPTANYLSSAGQVKGSALDPVISEAFRRIGFNEAQTTFRITDLSDERVAAEEAAASAGDYNF